MPHAEVSYRREGRNAESSERIRCVAVWAGSGQDLNECLARFLSIQPNETRRELQRLKAEGLLVTPDNPNDPRLTRWLRVEGFTKPRRAYLFVGDAATWSVSRRTYRPPPSHLRREGNPKLGRLLAPFKV